MLKLANTLHADVNGSAVITYDLGLSPRRLSATNGSWISRLAVLWRSIVNKVSEV